MSKKKTKPITGAPGFYVYKMLSELALTDKYVDFKFSMPVYAYISIPKEMADNEDVMEHVTKEGILAVIYEAEAVIAKYKALL